jgi:hypothetical protein
MSDCVGRLEVFNMILLLAGRWDKVRCCINHSNGKADMRALRLCVCDRPQVV